MPSHRAIGNQAEDLACIYLQEQGYQILARNFTIRGGELDIVAQKDGVIVCIEVKARFINDFGLSEESITARKLKFLQRALSFYLHRFKLEHWPCRIDLVAINYREPMGTEIRLLENISD